MNRILRDASPSEIEGKLLAAMVLFSNGLVLDSLEHRLLHALVSMESLLLKDGNEPIVERLGLRLAHRLGRSVEDRRAISEAVKGAYGLRSGFVHHGRPTPGPSIDLLNQAIQYSWLLLRSLLQDPRVRQRELTTKDQLIRELDDRAFA